MQYSSVLQCITFLMTSLFFDNYRLRRSVNDVYITILSPAHLPVSTGRHTAEIKANPYVVTLHDIAFDPTTSQKCRDIAIGRHTS